MKKQFLLVAATFALSLGIGTQASAQAPYTVKAGDTLYKISRTSDVSVQTLKDLNKLKSNTIYSGQKLLTSASSSSAVTYTVKSGDNLSKIAQAHGVSLSTLMSQNKLTSNLIRPGLKLIVGGAAVPAAVTKTAAKPTATKSNVVKEMTVSATAYTASCKGCSGVTATGINLKSNPNQKVIAVDPTVIPLGSKVWVEGYGEAIAGDKGSAIKGNKIDVFIPAQADAIKWGRKNVKLQILK